MSTFKKGDRVRLSKRGIDANLATKAWHEKEPPTKGTIIAEPTKPGVICVRRDNRKTHAHYAEYFWEPDTP